LAVLKFVPSFLFPQKAHNGQSFSIPQFPSIFFRYAQIW